VFVQANAEHLPLRNDSLDCVVSIRFMMRRSGSRAHAARVPSRLPPLVIIDYRHCYFVSLRAHAHVRQARHRPPAAVARVAQELDKEFADAGFAIRKVIRVLRLRSRTSG
jgi:hypothetical protein